MVQRLESAWDAQWTSRSTALHGVASSTCAALGVQPDWHGLHGQMLTTWATLFGALGLAAAPIRTVVSTVDLRKFEQSFVIHFGAGGVQCLVRRAIR